MRFSSRGRTLLALSAVAVVAVLGLAACGQGADRATAASDDANYTDLGWDAQALESIGFTPNDVSLISAVDPATAAPTASPSAGAKAKDDRGAKLRHLRQRIRFGFGRNLLHGEAVVKTEDGTKTVVVQRGTVTAITSTSVTVKSSDGFTLTWTFGNPFTVIKDRAKVDPGSVAVGSQVGVAGSKDGSATTARLMVVPKPR